MKKIIMLSFLCSMHIATHCTQEELLPTNNNTEQFSPTENNTYGDSMMHEPGPDKKSLYDHLQETSSVGLCCMSLGVGLLCKFHPIVGGSFLAAGFLLRKAPHSQGYEHIKDGAYQIQNAEDFQGAQAGAREVLRGTVQCGKDALSTIEQFLAKKD